jgi:hypothetical protein
VDLQDPVRFAPDARLQKLPVDAEVVGKAMIREKYFKTGQGRDAPSRLMAAVSSTGRGRRCNTLNQ